MNHDGTFEFENTQHNAKYSKFQMSTNNNSKIYTGLVFRYIIITTQWCLNIIFTSVRVDTRYSPMFRFTTNTEHSVLTYTLHKTPSIITLCRFTQFTNHESIHPHHFTASVATCHDGRCNTQQQCRFSFSFVRLKNTRLSIKRCFHDCG